MVHILWVMVRIGAFRFRVEAAGLLLALLIILYIGGSLSTGLRIWRAVWSWRSIGR